MTPDSVSAVRETVHEVVARTPVYDIHTHLYDRAFGSLSLWGIDELLTYHYLIAESLRWSGASYEKFWGLSKAQQAELIWDELFLRHSPISEACRGVVTTLNALGLDVKRRDLPALRQEYARWTLEDFTTRAMEVAKVRKICMTNSPFDDQERPVWEQGFARDERFVAALRIDPLLLEWEKTAPRLRGWGYEVREDFSGQTYGEIRRFLGDWTKRIDAQYCMVSLAPDFQFPGTDAAARIIEHALMPHGREHGQAFALMIGVKRGANPLLRLAGDSVGPADVGAVERLCAAFPENKFLCTMLARENQHGLCVAARKFRNLHVFGCWWFLNNPSLIEEITRMRLELIGLSCTPQHSDCRVLDQLIYKWAHSRPILAKVLGDKYADLAAAGWAPTRAEIERDVHGVLGGALESFLGR
ncbi:MAG TPA: glucuronate isomerase [Chthoniobacteraceae bacterium]|jgi:hypothetical protein|nr:glucuronate isomerase [Chthoniobacteraceae bacterium]